VLLIGIKIRIRSETKRERERERERGKSRSKPINLDVNALSVPEGEAETCAKAARVEKPRPPRHRSRLPEPPAASASAVREELALDCEERRGRAESVSFGRTCGRDRGGFIDMHAGKRTGWVPGSRGQGIHGILSASRLLVAVFISAGSAE